MGMGTQRDRETEPGDTPGTRRGPGQTKATLSPPRCHRSIPGSAVCAFYLADVERSFEGPFAELRGVTWTAVPEDRVPQPRYPPPHTGTAPGAADTASPHQLCRRPGCCAGMGPAAGVVTSGDFPDETLVFAKEHPLLHGAVSPAGGRPLFTRTGTRCGDSDRVASGVGWPRGWGGLGDGATSGTGNSSCEQAQGEQGLRVLQGAGSQEGAGSPRAQPSPSPGVEAVSCRRLTQLAADTGAGPRGNQTVLFLGAEDGRVLKVLAAAQSPEATQPRGGTAAPGDTREPGDSGDSSAEALLLEDISLYDPAR